MNDYAAFPSCTAPRRCLPQVGHALLVLAFAFVPVQAGAQRANGCTLNAWEPMQLLATSDHRPVYIETPSWSTMSAGAVLIGFPTYVWQAANVLAPTGTDVVKQARKERNAGAFIGRDGTAVPLQLPVGVDDPIALLATTSGTDGIAVLWGSVPDSTFVGAGLAARTLWEARTNGEAWSHPSKVIELERIFWNSTQPVVIATRDRLEVAVPAYGRERDAWHSGIVLLMKERASWRHDWIETGLPPGYVALAVDDDKSAILAFIGGTQSPKAPMPYGIHVARRSGKELTWSTPRLVLSLGARGLAWFPFMLRMQDGKVHLLWADQPTAGRDGAAAIHHMVSADAGDNWSMMTDLPMPAEIDAMRAATIGTEAIVVVARLARSGRLVTATWSNSGWSALEQPFSEPALSVPTLATGKENEVLLTWGMGRAGAIKSDPAFPAPALVYARRSAVCPKQSLPR